MAEKNNEKFFNRSTMIMLIALIGILIGIIIAIPIVYSVGRVPPKVNKNIDLNFLKNDKWIENECTLPSSRDTKKNDVLEYFNITDERSQPFPFRFLQYVYRPNVVSKRIYLIFGFQHDTKSWSLDTISVRDTTTNEEILLDGDFESNYLKKNYEICILSNTRTAYQDILFDNPHTGDFYYNDQTTVGMTYLSQELNIVGGRYYNITFYLENRGYPNNSFLLLVAY